MDEFIRRGSYGGARYGAVERTTSDKVAFLQKVYLLFTASLIAAAGGALVALYAGAGMSQARLTLEDGRALVVPPLVLFFSNHPIVAMVLFLGTFFFASWARERPGINVAALLGAGFISGLYIAPAIWFATAMASGGHTLSTSPVRDAFLLSVAGFGGLSAYALTTKRDLSFLGSFLSIGFWVVLGACLLSFFFHSEAFGLAVSSVIVLLFGGFIVYDTSRMARDPSNRDPVGAALTLYVNFLNLFIALLRILSSSRRES